MVRQAAQHLIATIRDPSSTEAAQTAAAQSLFDALGPASEAEANDALSTLVGSLDLADPSRVGFLAVVCGALVERGCDPSILAPTITERLRPLLESSVALADACLARMPTSEGEDRNPAEVFEEVREQQAEVMPAEAAAWEALDCFWCPAIAAFSVSASARAAARGLRELAARISAYHEGGHWLDKMLSVLDDEPILAIEPQTTLGILARISGVVDNFQLNVLLMNGFPATSILSPRRVSRRVVNVARGEGPQQTEDVVTGVWNLYTWQAIEPGFRLPDPNDYGSRGHWIWNEGIPEDIPVFEGRRVILLGPASYSRSWPSQRMFDKLPAKLECERKLAKGEVHDWLQRMVSAKGVD